MRLTTAVATAFLVASCAAPSRVSPSPTSDHDRVERFEIDGRPSALTVGGGYVWVADDENHTVHVLDEATGEAAGEPIEVERNPIAMSWGPGAVWVGHAGGELVRIDVRSRDTSKAVKAGASITDVIAWRDHVFVIDNIGRTASDVDAETSNVSRGVAVAEGAVRGVVGKEGLWVSGTESTVSRIELDEFVVRHLYPDVGGGPIGLAWDGRVIWAAISDDGTIVDVEGKTYPKPVRVGGAPVAIAQHRQVLFVGCQDTQTLVQVEDGEVVGEPVDLGIEPRGVVAARGVAWVAGTGTNSGAVIRVEPA